MGGSRLEPLPNSRHPPPTEAELRALPGGHQRNAELVDELAFLRNRLPSRDPIPGTIRESDFRLAMQTGGMGATAEQDVVLDALEALKLDPAAKLRFSFAIEHSTPESLT